MDARLSLLLLASLAMSGAEAGALRFVANAENQFDYGQQVVLPSGFGQGEFTLELWLLLDTSFDVGPCRGDGRLIYWCTQDEQPYDNSAWWFDGNWTLDGHNNAGWSQGSFDLQVYGGGRLRWLFGDGLTPSNWGGTWAVQAWPADTTATLLDDQWHQVTLVRRWVGASDAQLEMWIDGALVATEISPGRVDMVAEYWSDWASFPVDQPGWFWGAEKQVAVSDRSPLEDYKGLLDELRFWSRAKTPTEINRDYAAPVTGTELGLVGVYRFEEGGGDASCDSAGDGGCIALFRTDQANWSTDQAPTIDGVLVFADGFESSN